MTKAILDWISATYKGTTTLPGTARAAADAGEQAVGKAAKKEGWLRMPATFGAGRNGYNRSLIDRHGATIAFDGSASMGVHVSLPGQSLSQKAPMEQKRILARLLNSGASLTRLDVAVDTDAEMDARGLKEQILQGIAVTRVLSVPTLVEGSGETLYVGSRKSEKLLRIYDKAAEQKIEGSWWRIELQLRGDAARKAGGILAHEGFGAIPGLIRGFCHWPNDEAWLRALGNGNIQIVPSQAKKTNTRNWLLGRVAETMAKEAAKDPGLLKEFVQEVGVYLKEFDTLDKSG